MRCFIYSQTSSKNNRKLYLDSKLFAMKKILLVVLLSCSLAAYTQDLTGTWEGNFVRGITGLQRVYKLRIELVQIENDVYGLVTRFPQDTKPDDKPDVIYTVSGRLGKKQAFPFQLFKGKDVETSLPSAGIVSSDPLFEFIVNYALKDSVEYIGGKWFASLEPVASNEKGTGIYQVSRITTTVSDRLYGLHRSKKIIDKLSDADIKRIYKQ